MFRGEIGRRWLRARPQIQNNFVVFLPLPPLDQLIVTSPRRPRPLDYLSKRFEKVRGHLFHWPPLPSTSCAEEKPQATIAPSSCCRGGCFISPTAKSTAKIASEARGGISNGVGWLLWPSDMVSVAIGHGFGGRLMVDGCFCCELCAKKYGTFVRMVPHKKMRSAPTPNFAPT